jgi:hypothetical protein
MSYRERAAWISLVTTVAIWGYYCVRAFPALASGTADAGDFVGLFIGCTILSVVVQVALTIASALMSPDDAEASADEREMLYELRSSRVAYYLLSMLVATVALATPIVVAASPQLFPTNPLASAVLVMGNLALLSLILAETVRSVTQIVHFRGAA